ncbi:hypothetical protein [Cupriavidus basilensis]|uniref:hypothetical protein n=1 Tax=Cupriavidus basilensis TaxID=68895 RepID=UPI0020A69BC9|nr:hypothetical protein [Cupriavidus basilensis]MCP3019257.1 hypothetical protein [Cupriavidus basilensis]
MLIGMCGVLNGRAKENPRKNQGQASKRETGNRQPYAISHAPGARRQESQLSASTMTPQWLRKVHAWARRVIKAD